MAASDAPGACFWSRRDGRSAVPPVRSVLPQFTSAGVHDYLESAAGLAYTVVLGSRRRPSSCADRDQAPTHRSGLPGPQTQPSSRYCHTPCTAHGLRQRPKRRPSRDDLIRRFERASATIDVVSPASTSCTVTPIDGARLQIHRVLGGVRQTDIRGRPDIFVIFAALDRSDAYQSSTDARTSSVSDRNPAANMRSSFASRCPTLHPEPSQPLHRYRLAACRRRTYCSLHCRVGFERRRDDPNRRAPPIPGARPPAAATLS